MLEVTLIQAFHAPAPSDPSGGVRPSIVHGRRPARVAGGPRKAVPPQRARAGQRPSSPRRVPMDSPHLSREIVEELGAVFVAAVEQAGPTLLTADLDEIEQHL